MLPLLNEYVSITFVHILYLNENFSIGAICFEKKKTFCVLYKLKDITPKPNIVCGNLVNPFAPACK